MNRIYTQSLLSIMGSLNAFAQSETTDSVEVQGLDEFVIEAPKVIRKADMDVYHPSESAVEHSKNGLGAEARCMLSTKSLAKQELCD